MLVLLPLFCQLFRSLSQLFLSWLYWEISHVLSRCLDWWISHCLFPCLDFPIIVGATLLYCSIFNTLPSTVDASNTLDLVFAYAISCWTFSSPASFSAICHLIKNDSLTSSSAYFASCFTALVLELSNLLLQLDLFEAFGLLLLLVPDKLAFVGL